MNLDLIIFISVIAITVGIIAWDECNNKDGKD
jgi:hypothetical protein